jgi:hypothetical protein
MTLMIMRLIWAALAMSYAWGVRGTVSGAMRGAMFAGAVLGLSTALLSTRADVQQAYFLLAAAGAIGLGFGGCMTYGQTLGLIHDYRPAPLYWWGLLGTAVKGCVWIGLGALLIAMLGGPAHYSWFEWGGLAVAGTFAWAAGILLLNRPHAPPDDLPRVYFSKRGPDARLEYWGGMWGLFAVLFLYAWRVRQDSFACGMAGFGLLGGLGFPLGQILQAWGRHRIPFGPRLQHRIDWWKVMEFTFGAVAGICVIGGWLHLEKSIPEPMPSSWITGASNSPLATIFLVMWAVAILLEPYWGPHRSPQRTWQTLALCMGVPLLGVASGAPLWARWVAGPLMFWVVGITVPNQHWKRIRGQSWVYLAIFAVITGAAIWVTWGNPSAVQLWRGLIMYHFILVLLKEWTLTHETWPTLRAEEGSVRALLQCLGGRNPVVVVFALQVLLLIIWQPMPNGS